MEGAAKLAQTPAHSPLSSFVFYYRLPTFTQMPTFAQQSKRIKMKIVQLENDWGLNSNYLHRSC